MAVGLMLDFRRAQELAGLFEVWVRVVPIALGEQVIRNAEFGLDIVEQAWGADLDVLRSGAAAEHEDEGEGGRVTLKHGSVAVAYRAPTKITAGYGDVLSHGMGKVTPGWRCMMSVFGGGPRFGPPRTSVRPEIDGERRIGFEVSRTAPDEGSSKMTSPVRASNVDNG
jgi:hypothetical protein